MENLAKIILDHLLAWWEVEILHSVSEILGEAPILDHSHCLPIANLIARGRENTLEEGSMQTQANQDQNWSVITLKLGYDTL